MMKKFLLICAFLFHTAIFYPQTVNNKWIPVSSDKVKNILLDTTGLNAYTGNDFFVWALYEYNSSVPFENVSSSVYKQKIFYHIDRVLRRYSIEQIVLYDDENNVIKNFNYEHKSDDRNYIFSNPVIAGSDVEKLLDKCVDYLSKPKEIIK